MHQNMIDVHTHTHQSQHNIPGAQSIAANFDKSQPPASAK
jgi:hypothetical protein